MLLSDIKSRPVYKGLEPDPNARHNLVAAEGEGVIAVKELAARAIGDFLARTDILYVAGASAGKSHGGALSALGARDYWEAPSIQTLLVRLDAVLNTATMGTRLYLSGTEGFIAQAMVVALAHGMNHHSVQTEHRGSLARRVQCVHCKGITEDVRTNPAVCAHCGLNLLVRDHYSRRIGAFMGVCIDAEAPGEIPPTEELYA